MTVGSDDGTTTSLAGEGICFGLVVLIFEDERYLGGELLSYLRHASVSAF